MPIDQDRLEAIVAELASRPGHEVVRVLIHELLVHGLGARDNEVHHEVSVWNGEVHGRIDALLGRRKARHGQAMAQRKRRTTLAHQTP